MRYLECEIIRILGNVTYFASKDDLVNVVFPITNAVVELKENINPLETIPVVLKGDLNNTVPHVKLPCGNCPIRVESTGIMEYGGELQITFELDDISDYYVEIDRNMV